MTIYRVPITLTYSDPGSPAVSVWHVRSNSGPGTDAAELQGLVDLIHSFYFSIGNNHAPGLVIGLGTVTNVDDQSIAAPSWTNIVSANSSGKAPPHLAVCVNWLTSIAARRARGRTFLGPWSYDQLGTDGHISAGTLTAINNAANALVSASKGSGNGAVGVYGLQSKAPKDYWKTSGNTGQELPHVLRDVIGHSAKAQLAVMRSRRD